MEERSLNIHMSQVNVDKQAIPSWYVSVLSLALLSWTFFCRLLITFFKQIVTRAGPAQC